MSLLRLDIVDREVDSLSILEVAISFFQSYLLVILPKHVHENVSDIRLLVVFKMCKYSYAEAYLACNCSLEAAWKYYLCGEWFHSNRVNGIVLPITTREILSVKMVAVKIK